MDDDLKTVMDDPLVQCATFGLPIFVLLLVVVWGCLRWSVIHDFWKQFRSRADKPGKLRILNSFASGVLSIILIVLFFGVLAGIGKLGTALLLLKGGDSEELRWLGLTFVGLLTALAGILSAPLAIIRVNVTERQTSAEEEQTDIKRREYTTSLINQATEHLGASLGEDSAKPNIPLRIGGLLALERIAQNNIEDYHVQIMDMICAYIRENSPYTKSNTDEVLQTDAQPAVPPPVRMDIQFAIDILARRTPEQVEEESRQEGYHLNLDHTNLTDVDFVRRNRKSDFSNASFSDCFLVRANFKGARLEGARLEGAHLEGAHLERAHLEGARLMRAHLERAYLGKAHLERARLMRAHLEGARLWEAHLERARLMRAHLEGARLWEAHLEGANLRWAHLEGAYLEGTNLEGADLRWATVTGAKFDDAKMEETKPDKSVILAYVKKDKRLPYGKDSD